MSEIIDYQNLKYLATGAWILLGAYRGHVSYLSGFCSRADPNYYYTTDVGYTIAGANIHMFLGGLMTIFPPSVVVIGVTELYNLENLLRGRNVD